MEKKKPLSVITNLQIVFWVSFIFLSLYSFSQTTSFNNSIARLFIILPLQLLLFYSCYLYLIPVYFEKKKYIQFYCLLVLLIASTTAIRLVLRQSIFTWIGGGKIIFSNEIQILIIVVSQLIIVLIACLLGVAKQKYEYEKKYQETKQQFLESELNYLKSQISPHFLLNTLNNIYSFAVTNSPQTPDAVMKLSELLKYFLYESSREKIMLGRELEIIQSYIALYQMRFQQTLNISTKFTLINLEKEIEPLLLMSIVENAFKHSGISFKDDSFIHITAEEKNNQLIFLTQNSKMPVNETISQYGGIGLRNIAKRLAINYPGNHELIINEDENTFSVKLLIPFL